MVSPLLGWSLPPEWPSCPSPATGLAALLALMGGTVSITSPVDMGPRDLVPPSPSSPSLTSEGGDVAMDSIRPMGLSGLVTFSSPSSLGGTVSMSTSLVLMGVLTLNGFVMRLKYPPRFRKGLYLLHSQQFVFIALLYSMLKGHYVFQWLPP